VIRGSAAVFSAVNWGSSTLDPDHKYVLLYISNVPQGHYRPDRKVGKISAVRQEPYKKAEQEKFNNIPKKVLQNAMVQKMVERVHVIQDAEEAGQEERDAVGDRGGGCNV
jgi:hypothetical protein